MIAALTTTFKRFPRKFWLLVGTSFIDNMGSTMVMPFFALYITNKFGVGMAQAGVMLGIFSFSGFVGGLIGGALSDRFGRRKVIIFGLIFSALSSIAFGIVNEYTVFYVLAVLVGIPSKMASPAFTAMVADVLPEEQRAEGYGLIRVGSNLAWVIGPVIAALLISYSYLFIFIGDAIASLIVAGIFFKIMAETKPDRDYSVESEPLRAVFLGYFKVGKDWLFLAFTAAMILCLIPYMQAYSTLPVFLRDAHGMPDKYYGYLASASGIMVVLAQFWVSSKVSKRKPMQMLALASFFFMIGSGMYGFVSSFALFVVGILLLTVGEMVALPVAQAVIAKFAPDHMRGRYMAFYSLSWLVPSTFGPGAAGLILDNYNPNWVWYLCAIISLVAIGLFLMLNRRVEDRTAVPVPEGGISG